jgi:uncharacterized cupin superfamily protein
MQPILKANPASAVALVDSPIPVNEITGGKPIAKIWVNAQSPDLKITQGVWECTAGTFTHEFTWDEFVMILEGEVTITPEGGYSYTLRAGDFAHFPVGLKTKWQIPKYIRKTFVIRTADPLKV